MYYKITNLTDVECLKRCIENRKGSTGEDEYCMFSDVVSTIENNINILSENYGDNRDSDGNLGGYLLLFNSTEDEKLINVIYERYGINDEYVEFEDTLTENDKVKWISKLFIVSSDYSVVIILPIAKKDSEKYRLTI